MAFYLSPLVDVKEIDLSTTIPAVATSIGVISLRNTKKGPEMAKILVSSEDEMVRIFGKPWEPEVNGGKSPFNYRDMLAAAGFLKFGNKLYCTRVLPNDATFGGVILNNQNDFASFTETPGVTAYTLQELNEPGSDWADPETADTGRFGITVQPQSNEFLQFIAASRGSWGNDVRVAFLSMEQQRLINNNQNEPTVPALSGWYPWEYDTDPANIGNLVLRAPWDDATLSNPATSADWQNWREATYDAVASTDMTLQSINPSDYTETDSTELVMVIQARDNKDDDWDTVEAWRLSTKVEAIDENGYPMYMETRLNEASQQVRVTLNATFEEDNWTVSTPEWIYFTDGSDGTIDPAFGTSLDTLRYALDLYDNPEEIDVNLLIDGDKPLNTKRYMIEFCEKRKDCMAILDCPKNLVVDNRGRETTDLSDWRRGLGAFAGGNNLNENTSYAALYGNWIEVFDKYNNKYRWIPTAGHVGGIYAKTDNVNDPWWAPAGLNRAVLTSIRRLAWNPALGHRDILYKNGINPIVSFAGQGKVIWGQKTMLDKPSSFNRVNVRRLFIVLEKAISTASKYFLFEPNDAITRRQLVTMIEPFLRDVQARRGVYDFQVICDETNNTPERIDRNELWCTILIKATRVAEFIVLQFVSLKTGASFEESAAQVNPQVPK